MIQPNNLHTMHRRITPEQGRRMARARWDKFHANHEPEPRGGSCAPAPCSAIVYSGPHYGRTHKIIKRTGSLVWVEYRGDRFAVPHCDVEELEQSPKSGLGAAGAQMQDQSRDLASRQPISPNTDQSDGGDKQ